MKTIFRVFVSVSFLLVAFVGIIVGAIVGILWFGWQVGFKFGNESIADWITTGKVK